MEPYKELIGKFQEILKENSLKMTKQREIILQTIYEYEGHFIPEGLHKKVQESYPELKVGIATIYRTLQLLESENIVTSISFGANGKKYEYGGKDHHDHMICNKCGRLIEFCDDTIEKQQEKIAKKARFKIVNHSMQIYGICQECQENKK
ncbi:MAG: transcriptional repressor [Campylobacterales bacterium]|nr:transcriptional repressor [Campylobacterales bacterium]